MLPPNRHALPSGFLISCLALFALASGCSRPAEKPSTLRPVLGQDGLISYRDNVADPEIRLADTSDRALVRFRSPSVLESEARVREQRLEEAAKQQEAYRAELRRRPPSYRQNPPQNQYLTSDPGVLVRIQGILNNASPITRDHDQRQRLEQRRQTARDEARELQRATEALDASFLRLQRQQEEQLRAKMLR
jgi:hypothetical protein